MTSVQDDEAIFTGEGGRQIKFFVQKDLDAKIIENLNEKITANGGRVEAKVPIQGFILIEPKSAEGLRLIDCWSTMQRPLRSFVPQTFVAACLQARKVLPQVFRKNGEPITIHIHSSITNEKMVEALTGRIWHSGGDPTVTEEEANVIIADERTPVFRALIERYDHSHNKYVEPIPWVKQCVESGIYENTPVLKKNLGGRVPGTKRTEFSTVDDVNLANYIASRLPDPSMRGRTGNKLYQDLCSRLDLYPWATRHPWQSWRERYKNNVSRFGRLIATHVEQHPVPEDGKGLHGFVRAPTASPAKVPTKEQTPANSEYHIEKKRLQREAPEEFDAEWGSQWDVKVGRKSPPAWEKGKRKAGDIQEGPEGPSKKLKTCTGRGGSVQGRRRIDEMAASLRAGNSPIGDAVAEEGSSRRSWPLMNAPEPENMLESSDPEPDADAVTGDAASHTSKTRSQSPGESSEVVSAPPTLSAKDPESDDEGLGSETQVFLAAHKNMLSGSFAPRSPVSPSEVHRIGETREQLKHTGPLTVVQQFRAKEEPAGSDAEHALARIACEYRFVLEEVKEEYEELNCDLEATRLHFQEIRAIVAIRKKMRKASGSR